MKISNFKFQISKRAETRYLNEMREVLCDQKWLKTAKNFGVYRAFRGVKKNGGLRYDVTVMPPKMLGKEFPKTKGNRNSNNFFELYIVLGSEALVLMQKMKGKTAKDVVAIKAKRGDYIIEPPDYYVITINPSKKLLKIGTWVSEKNKNIYKELEKMHGACYYYTKSGWIKNKNYKSIPKLRFEKPLNPVRKTKIIKAIESLKFSNRVKSIPKDLSFLKG